MISVNEHCGNVAVHEAGHAIVARFYGATAATFLYMERGALGGYTEYYGDLTDQQFKIVSLAGTASQALWNRPSVTAEQLLDEKWTPSPRDAKDAGDFNTADLAECLDIIRSNWSAVEAEAALLLRGLIGTRDPIKRFE
jgi:hypothetical protein